MPRIGASEAAAIFGWRSARSWKRHVPNIPDIRNVKLLNGTYYILEDVLRARYPHYSDNEIKDELVRYQESRRLNGLNRKPHEWLSSSECARLAGFKSPQSWKKNIRRFSGVRVKKTRLGKFYELRSVFEAAFPEASKDRLDEIITDYRLRRYQKLDKEGEK